MRAAADSVSIKELLRRYVERGLREPTEAQQPRGRRSPLPVIIPRTGVPIRAFTNAELHRIEEEEDIARMGRT